MDQLFLDAARIIQQCVGATEIACHFRQQRFPDMKAEYIIQACHPEIDHGFRPRLGTRAHFRRAGPGSGTMSCFAPKDDVQHRLHFLMGRTGGDAFLRPGPVMLHCIDIGMQDAVGAEMTDKARQIRCELYPARIPGNGGKLPESMGEKGPRPVRMHLRPDINQAAFAVTWETMVEKQRVRSLRTQPEQPDVRSDAFHDPAALYAFKDPLRLYHMCQEITHCSGSLS